MKRTLNKLIGDEKGQALIIALILMLVGGLIITPLLGFMGTGLIVGQVFEERMDELYAADAGIEDALHKIVTDDASLPQSVGDDPWTDNITVNAKGVEVEVVLVEDTELLLSGLSELIGEHGESEAHPYWAVVIEQVGEGTFTMSMTYDGEAETKKIYGFGAWLQWPEETTDYWDYVDGSASGVTDEDPQVVPFEGGTAFIWEWTAANRPEFQKGETNTQTFEFTPEEIPSFSLSWVHVGSADVAFVPSIVGANIWKVTATASSTGKQTEVVAYVSREGNTVSIISWEVSLQ